MDNTPNNGSATYGFTINGDVIPVQSTGTTWDGFCGSRNNNDQTANLVNLYLACYNLADGTSRANPPGLNDVLPDLAGGWFFGTDSYGGVATFGHRVYFNMFDVNWSDDTAVCYDYAANNGAGGVCDNYPYRYLEDDGGRASTSLNLYALALDATGSCLWGYGDGRQFVAGTSIDPSKGCASATTSATTLPVTPTTSFCGTNSSGATWGAINLRDLAVSDYTSATVTVKDNTGTPVTGFNAIALPPSQSIDITSIPKSGSTASLSVSVAFTGINNAAFSTNHAVLETTWSTAIKPAVCFTTTTTTPTCATGQSLTATASTVLSDVAHSANVALSASNTLASTDSAPGTPCPGAAPLSSTGTTGHSQTAAVTVPGAGSVTLLGALGQSVTTTTLPGVGTYVLDAGTGIITFTPTATYTGQPAPVRYQITDTNGQTATSTYTPTVTTTAAPPPSAPSAPAPAALHSTGPGPAAQHVTVPLPAGTTLALLQAGQPVPTVTITGVGTYTINTTTHVITFTPAPGYVGTPTGVSFQVTDASNRSGTALYVPTVTKPAPPTAVAMTSTGPGVQRATIAHEDGQSVTLLDAAGDPTSTAVTITGEGTYVLNSSSGIITFTPVAGFTGTGVGVGFQVSDDYDQHTLAAYTPTVQTGTTPTPAPTPTPTPAPAPKPLPKIDRSKLVKIPTNPQKVTGKERKTKAYNSSYTGIDAYPITKLGTRQLRKGQATTLSGDGLFDFDKATLTKTGRVQVKAAVYNLRGSKNVRCEGYTDYAGARDHEMSLSLRRAKTICTALKIYGAKVTTKTQGYGPQRPVVVGGSARGRKENRRVVIIVTK